MSVAGRVVARTREALTLREASYSAVQYISRKDVGMSLLERTNHVTSCPYKGDCAYYSREIKGHIAFYSDRIWPDPDEAIAAERVRC